MLPSTQSTTWQGRQCLRVNCVAGRMHSDSCTGLHGNTEKFLKWTTVHRARSRISRSPGRRGLWTVMPSQSSLTASLLGALSIACVAFENVARTWVGQELPVYHQTQVSLGVYRPRMGLYTWWRLACGPWESSRAISLGKPWSFGLWCCSCYLLPGSPWLGSEEGTTGVQRLLWVLFQ